MKTLIVGLNFWPEEVGIGKYTSELAFHLAESGHLVRVVSSQPYYPYWHIFPGYDAWSYTKQQMENLEVFRVPLWVPHRPNGFKRLLHHVSFALFSIPSLVSQLTWKPDIILSVAPSILSTPLVLMIARLCGAKSWLHLQDFELDAAANLNMLAPFVIMIARRVERRILMAFDRVSTISGRMKERLLSKGVNDNQSVLLPNWVDTDEIYPLRSEKNPLRSEFKISGDKVVVLYAGNLGFKQGLEVILSAARSLIGRSEIIFIIAGDGAMKAELVENSRDLVNLRYLPLQPRNRLNELLNLADIHLLPQDTGAEDLVMPSKLSGMLASGKAVVAIANANSAVGTIVGQAGIVVPPKNPKALTRTILALVDDPRESARIGELGRKYACIHLRKKTLLRQFELEIEQFVSAGVSLRE